MRAHIGIGLLLLVLLGGSGCFARAGAEEKWGPFRGKVVDLETGKPIQGAVALVVWEERIPTHVQDITRFYDAREAVSGPDGTFEIPRRDPPIITFHIYRYGPKVFAPGYAEHRWIVTPPTGEALIDPTVIEMRRLRTREERLEGLSLASHPDVPLEKRCLYTRALNQERKNLGFGGSFSECTQ